MFLGHFPTMTNKTHLKATFEIHGSLEQSKKKHMEKHYI
jgi:hypothetical protein